MRKLLLIGWLATVTLLLGNAAFGMRPKLNEWVSGKFPGFTEVVGEGGQGTIYGSMTQPIAIKASPVPEVCVANEKEFQFQKRVYDAYLASPI